MFLRDQPVGEERQLEFASGFGKVSVYPVLKLLGIDKPLETIEDSEESPPGADTWHTDVTWIECPPKVAMICALDIPEYGGDTMWANMHAAYDALSGDIKEKIDGMTAVHSFTRVFGARLSEEKRAEMQEKYPDARHPVVRTHPETGAKSLYVNAAFVSHLEGIDEVEGRRLLRLLYRQSTVPEFQCRFRWRKESVAFWDNRATWHYALNDYHGHRREMHRITLEGEPLP